MISNSFVYKEKEIAYIVERKKVKNINLRITKDGSVVVSANEFVDKDIIDAFVKSKGEWLYKNISHIEKLKREIRNIKTISLKYAYYLGENYLIKCIGNENNSCISNNELQLAVSENNKEEALQEWYLKKAEEVFLEIFERLYEKIYPSRKIKPKISIKKMKTRWGSCNKKLNRINLNLKLIHQPLVCIEYVITHELIHLMHPNHSKKFYNMLEVVMPDYKSKKKMLNSILVYI